MQIQKSKRWKSTVAHSWQFSLNRRLRLASSLARTEDKITSFNTNVLRFLLRGAEPIRSLAAGRRRRTNTCFLSGRRSVTGCLHFHYSDSISGAPFADTLTWRRATGVNDEKRPAGETAVVCHAALRDTGHQSHLRPRGQLSFVGLCSSSLDKKPK